MTPSETLPSATVHVGDTAKLMLLQRVGGPVADDLQSHLQPMLLLDELLRVTLARPDLDAQALPKYTEWIRPAVQGAMKACAAAAEWLLPLPGASTPSAQLAAECAALLRPEFELCGLRIELECEGEALALGRDPGRTMLCAVLAHAGDHAEGPERIVMQLKHREGLCEVRVSRRPATGAVATDFLRPGQAPLAWGDLLALAAREGVPLRRESDGTLVLELAAAPGAAS
ncbi:hypothetical protein GCM10028796_18700 [Ramlibacter monticola]|uniref:Uncharacterized protein n=1 Tax=Ramlibacter monticola TaxID=1926872 RepID=A0A937CUK3_9BURK|nr:hypothetical protein [Ramlibacter monticola]MBL0392132.1 hypothetical protein [Ramlibacter monticola]